MAFYLGIDIGTSAVKVILLDEAQREHALAARVLSVQRPAPGFSEQFADDWWQAVDSAVSEIAAKCPIEIAAVRAIGLSGQMHGLVPLDSQNTLAASVVGRLGSPPWSRQKSSRSLA